MAVDRRKTRRALTVDEARRLLEVSDERRLYNATAILTGLRVNEIRQLAWSDLCLIGEKPHIQLRAATTKSARADRMDLHPDLVAMFGRAKLTAGDRVRLNPGMKVFASIPKLDTFKKDLVRAGIAKLDEKTRRADTRDDQGRTLDRHCLRNTFVSWLGAAGIDLRIAQRLARHTDVKLTANTYQDAAQLDTRAAIAKLPDLMGGKSQSEAAALRKTGTDDGVSNSVVLPVVLSHGISRPKVAAARKIRWRASIK